MKILQMFLLGGVLIVQTALMAAEPFIITKLNDSPKIDGLGNDQCWKDIPWRRNFYRIGTKIPASRQTRFKVFHDNWKIYTLIECDEDQISSIRTKTGTRPQVQTRWKDDSIEINIVPRKDAIQFYKWIVNPLGGVSEMALADDNTATNTFKENWNFHSGIEVKCSRQEKTWTVEAAIPLHAMDLTDTENQWRFNIGRNRYANGKKELSASSILSWPQHALPSEFQEVLLQGIRLEKYQWKYEILPPHVYRDKQQVMSCDLSCQITNETGDFALAFVEAELIDYAGKTISKFTSGQDPASFIFRKMRQIPMKMQIPGNGKYALNLTIIRLDGKKLSARRFPLEMSFNPIQIKVQKPVYRNCIFATMPDKQFIAKITVDPHAYTKNEIEVEFSGPGKKIVKKLPLKKQSAVFLCDMQSMPDGEYFLKCEGESVRIRKLPYLKGEVWFGEDGGARVDGKPFVPYGWSGPLMKDPVYTISDTGAGYRNSLDFMEMFERYRKTRPDAKIITTPFCEKDRAFPFKVFHYSQRKNRLTAQQRDLIARHLKIVQNDPVLFCYNGSDEPEGKDNIPEWYSDVRDAVEEFDPYHPILILNEGYSEIGDYARGGDVRMPDCYVNFLEPDTSRRPLYTISHYTRKARQYGPAWLMPQGFCWRLNGKIGRPPTFDEMRNQAWQIFANDGKGLIWYSTKEWSWLYDQIPVASHYIGTEVKLLTDFIVAKPDLSLKVKAVPEDPNFQYMLKRIGNRIALFAVNTSHKKMQVQFTFSNAPKKMYVLGEERCIACSNGFSDEFAPLATHVYISEDPPADFETLSQCKTKLEELHRKRFTPDNLIGTGPLVRQVYVDIDNGKIPAGFPQIKASSQIKQSYPRITNCLYFLLDGLRPEIPDNNSGYDAWRPLPEDRTPWIEIALCQTADVREIRLYTMHDKMDKPVAAQDFTIHAFENGEWKEIAHVENNDKHEVIIPVKCCSDRFKIQFQKVRNIAGIAPRLLSEIEIIGSHKQKGTEK